MESTQTSNQTDSADQHIRSANEAIKRHDYPFALSALAKVNLDALVPLAAVKVMMASGMCLHKLGQTQDSIAAYGKALNFFIAKNLLNPKSLTLDLLQIAMTLTVGARDKASLKDLLTIKFREFFSQPRDIEISPFENLSTWCRSHNVAVTQHEPMSEVVLDGPTINPNLSRYAADAFWSATIPNATMIPGWDFVISPDHYVLEGTSYLPLDTTFRFFPHLIYFDIAHVAHVWPSDDVYIDEDALFLNCPESFHFGHWLVDFLPRLRAWKPPMKIAIPNTLPAKHREALSYFGVKPNDILECTFAGRYRFRTLTMVQNGDYLRPSPSRVHYVHTALAKSPASPTQPHAGRRVFLTRATATRNIINVAAFASVLTDFGFESVDVATMSIAAQRDLFDETSIVMGVFGSDLLAMYHMRPGTHMIELIWDTQHDPIVPRTCAILGMTHHFLVCQAAEPSATSTALVKKIDRDVIVNCEALRDHLTAVIGR